jgi:hypothetical protein
MTVHTCTRWANLVEVHMHREQNFYYRIPVDWLLAAHTHRLEGRIGDQSRNIHMHQNGRVLLPEDTGGTKKFDTRPSNNYPVHALFAHPRTHMHWAALASSDFKKVHDEPLTRRCT